MYKNYLYFAQATPNGAAANEEVIMFGADSVSHFEMKDATKLHIFLRKTYGQEFNQDSDATPFIIVSVTINTGKHKEVMAHLGALISQGFPHSDGFTVVADSENSIFSHPDITGCNAIDVIDAA